MLTVLLYGAECWTLLQADLRQLEAFHNRCVRVILDVSRSQQWEERLTTASLHHLCGTESVSTVVLRRRLQWLGHVARMDESRLPKQFLFGWLGKAWPAHSPRRRWCDVVRDYLQSLHLYPSWYSLASDRSR